MNTKWKWLLASSLPSVVLFGVGCSAIKAYPPRSVNLRDQLENLSWCFKGEEAENAPATTPTPTGTPSPTASPTPQDPARHRNDVVNCRIQAIDLQFTAFEQSLAQESVSLNASVDMAVVGLGAATATIASSATKSILGAISGGIVGAKGIIDKDIFYSKTMPALLSQMEAQRKTQLVRIRTGLKRTVDEYPLSEALVDVEEYYKAGSIPAALQGIIEQSGAAGKEATEALKVLPRTSVADLDAMIKVRARFNALFIAWKNGSEGEPGKKALGDAKAILKQLQSDTTADDGEVFKALNEEIKRTDPGSKQLEKVVKAFGPS